MLFENSQTHNWLLQGQCEVSTDMMCSKVKQADLFVNIICKGFKLP